MKFDIIKPINECLSNDKANEDAKNCIELSPKQKELLELVLKQEFQQLDGLKYNGWDWLPTYVFFDDEEKKEIKKKYDSVPKGFNLVNRFGDDFKLYLDDDMLVLRCDNYFYLTIKRSYIEPPDNRYTYYDYLYTFNFTYGDDIICIKKEIKDNTPKITGNIYYNAVSIDNTHTIRLDFGKPIDLYPDKREEFKYYVEKNKNELREYFMNEWVTSLFERANGLFTDSVNYFAHLSDRYHKNDNPKFRKKMIQK